MKAKYIGKSYDKYSPAVHLFYEYRGHEYMITDEHNGCSETMCQKHKHEQDRIDALILEENKPERETTYEDTAEYGFDLFWQYVTQE